VRSHHERSAHACRVIRGANGTDRRAAFGYFGAAFDPTKGGSLEVNTSHLAPGYLRRNGVPYSDKTTVTEYMDRDQGTRSRLAGWVKTIVSDPTYLFPDR